METLPAASSTPHCHHSAPLYQQEVTSSGPPMPLRRQQVARGSPQRKRTPKNAAGTAFRQGTDSNKVPAYWGAVVAVLLAAGTVQAGRRALLWSGRQGQIHSREGESGVEVRSRCRSCSPYHYWMTRKMIRRDRYSAALSWGLRGVVGSEPRLRVRNGS